MRSKVARPLTEPTIAEILDYTADGNDRTLVFSTSGDSTTTFTGEVYYYTDSQIDGFGSSTFDTQYDITTLGGQSGTFRYGNGRLNADGLTMTADGKHLYTFVVDDDKIYIWRFELSTAWDIETASKAEEIDVSSFLVLPSYGTGISVAKSGKRIYVGDQGDREVHQLNLSTANDLSTYTKVASVTFSELDSNEPDGVTMKKDGTKLYLGAVENNNIVSYELTTPYDLETTTHLNTVDMTQFDDIVSLESPSVNFAKGGEKAYQICLDPNLDDNICEFDLSTGYDISTMSFNDKISVENTGINANQYTFVGKSKSI